MYTQGCYNTNHLVYNFNLKIVVAEFSKLYRDFQHAI